jgi:hypothetical protein
MEPEQDDSVGLGVAEFTVKAKALKIFELHADVTGYMEGQLQDWPPNIQDVIFAAMERVIKKTRVKGLDVIQSFCGRGEADQRYHVTVICCETKGEILIEHHRR